MNCPHLCGPMRTTYSPKPCAMRWIGPIWSCGPPARICAWIDREHAARDAPRHGTADAERPGPDYHAERALLQKT